MIVITVKYEADKPHEKSGLQMPEVVHLKLINGQTGLNNDVALRAGEAVEHRLRLEACGTLELKLQG